MVLGLFHNKGRYGIVFGWLSMCPYITRLDKAPRYIVFQANKMLSGRGAGTISHAAHVAGTEQDAVRLSAETVTIGIGPGFLVAFPDDVGNAFLYDTAKERLLIDSGSIDNSLRMTDTMRAQDPNFQKHNTYLCWDPLEPLSGIDGNPDAHLLEVSRIVLSGKPGGIKSVKQLCLAIRDVPVGKVKYGDATSALKQILEEKKEGRWVF